MAKNAGELRQQKNAEYRQKGEVVARRKEDVEHRTGGSPIDYGDAELRQRQSRRRNRKFPLEESESLVAGGAENEIRGDQYQTKRA